MPITTIYEVLFTGEKWVAKLGEQYLDRSALLARIKTLRKAGLSTEEEWAAYALIERRQTEARWETAEKK